MWTWGCNLHYIVNTTKWTLSKKNAFHFSFSCFLVSSPGLSNFNYIRSECIKAFIFVGFFFLFVFFRSMALIPKIGSDYTHRNNVEYTILHSFQYHFKYFTIESDNCAFVLVYLLRLFFSFRSFQLFCSFHS